MKATLNHIDLADGSLVAVIGGGPAGSFFAIHLLRQAELLGRKLRVTIFERRRGPALEPAVSCSGKWKGCNYCAGGISPRLCDVLNDLNLGIPEPLIQRRVRSVTVQGFWKNIELDVPPGREMLSVFRGSRPEKRMDRSEAFDCFLLDQALKAGASLVAGTVTRVERSAGGKPVIHYGVGGADLQVEADFVVFAGGVNEHHGARRENGTLQRSFRDLAPGFEPPRVRQALVFELEAKPRIPANLAETVHFVEYGSKTLRLEMCSLVPKRDFITVVLVGASIDTLGPHADTHQIIQAFLELPHVRKLIPSEIRVTPACACRPNFVVRSAQNAFHDRVAVIGDMATSRLYKDGILSAQRTAEALANALLERGADYESLREAYQPVLRNFEKDNRIAGLVFLLHRLFFSSSVLSRVLYQAVITERKTTPSPRRRLERILWKIASGDDQYSQIFLSMIHPATMWLILGTGSLTTLRNYLTECLFGLRWQGVSRFTTGVAIERLEEKRRQFHEIMTQARLQMPEHLEFERMYTIKICAPRKTVLRLLGTFGDPDRIYFKPRWLRVERISGNRNACGCVIRYRFAGGLLGFNLFLEELVDDHLLVYRIRDGFGAGGMLLFELEQVNPETCALSIYVAFDFKRGANPLTEPFRWLFRVLFPDFMHDVLWNHSLCQLKNLAESEEQVPGQVVVHADARAVISPLPERAEERA